MRAHVLGQVIIAHENAGAQSTAELLGPSVCLQVALQFIGAGEALAAEEPVADEGAVSTVPAQVGFQMRGLGVCFATAWDVTVVHVLPSAIVSTLAQLLSMNTVGAPTHSLSRASG